jgi:hypothetical protein
VTLRNELPLSWKEVFLATLVTTAAAAVEFEVPYLTPERFD